MKTNTLSDVAQATQLKTLRRYLRRDGMVLWKSRPRDVPQQGEWYIVDVATNAIVRTNVEIASELERYAQA